MYQGAWVIIQGEKGIGAIKSNNGNYEALASTGEEPVGLSDGRGGNILDFLKGKIGKLQKFYVGKNTRAASDKRSKRADAKKGAGVGEVTQETLIKKFRPLWVRAINAAIADVKGHISNMIKNDAFSKAQRKLNHLEKLQNGLEGLELGSSGDPEFISHAVNISVLMAASHFYPEQTGAIQKGYGNRFSAERSEGTQQLLKDISAGDQKKLGAVLSFFKRALISG